jgi:hypothetical protein
VCCACERTEDDEGPSNASWIIGGLNRTLEIPWPRRLYPEPVHIMGIDDHLLSIEGRVHFRVTSENDFDHRVWFEEKDKDGPALGAATGSDTS